MKKLNFELIKKIDYLLFFIFGLISVISFFGFIVSGIVELIPDNSSQPAIEIIDSAADSSKKIEIVEKIDFCKKMSKHLKRLGSL